MFSAAVKNLPAIQETRAWSLVWEDPLEEEMTTHSSILAWRLPWTEESGGLESVGGQKEEDTTERLSRHVQEIRSPKTDQGLKVPSLSVNALNCWFPPKEKGKLRAAVHFVMGREHRRLPLCKGLIEMAINIIILPHTLVSHGSKPTPLGHAHPPFCLTFSYTHLLLEGHC